MSTAQLRRPSPRLLAYVVLGVACAIAVAPFLYVLSASFKDGRSLFAYPPEWIPSPFVLDKYEAVLRDRPFLRWALNSVFVAGTVAVLKVFLDSLAGYALAKMSFAGRRVVFWLMLSTVMIPPAVLLIPLFFMVRDLGWLDTYWALIIPPLANPVGVFMMRAYIQALPDELEQSARVDDCNAFQVYWRIVLPLVRPGLVVVGTYTFLLQYTNFVWPLVVTQSEDMFLLTNGLASLNTVSFLRDWGLISAGAVLTMIPVTIAFLLFQRQFIGSSLAGALKE